MKCELCGGELVIELFDNGYGDFIFDYTCSKCGLVH